jgi:hypothetical protein
MILWMEHHGMEMLLAYLFYSSFVGSMPECPPNVGFFVRWGYQFLHALAGNWREVLKIALRDSNVPLPVPSTATIPAGALGPEVVTARAVTTSI